MTAPASKRPFVSKISPRFVFLRVITCTKHARILRANGSYVWLQVSSRLGNIIEEYAEVNYVYLICLGIPYTFEAEIIVFSK